MAREHARLLTRIWSDQDFRGLAALEQRWYKLLLSQGTINNAGLLPLQVTKWSRMAADTTVDDVLHGLERLEARRYAFVDHDTEEVLVRSYIRNDGIVKSPNMLKSALRQARLIESPKLRRVLAAELRRLDKPEATAVAEEIDPGPETPSPNPSGTLPEGFPEQHRTDQPATQPAVDSYAERKTSGTLPEPLPEPPGEGEGEGGRFFPVVGAVESTHARSSVADDRPGWNAPPSRCRKHRDTANPPPCRYCATAREARERWDVERAAAERAARSAETHAAAEARALAIANCGLCDHQGYDGLALCRHNADAEERLQRGLAEARAAVPPSRIARTGQRALGRLQRATTPSRPADPPPAEDPP